MLVRGVGTVFVVEPLVLVALELVSMVLVVLLAVERELLLGVLVEL